MKIAICKTVWVSAALFLWVTNLAAQKNPSMGKMLSETYDLVPVHSKDTQYYEMESKLQKHALDGKVQSTDIYRLSLRCVPSGKPAGKDQFTCLKFTVQRNGGAEMAIPALAGWVYYFSQDDRSLDDKGQVFGIDHAKFDGLKDETGNLLPVENKYHVYNAFIDFHAMGVFSERTANDSGIQHMHRIGDSVVHTASYSLPPVNLGADIARGSYFRNGRVTLLFKGLSLVNQRNCAIIEYDSGLSSFYMLTKLSENMEVRTNGSSHYWGDIYKDLAGGWIQKAVLHELVISETTIPSMTNKVNSVIERSISIKNVQRPF